MRISWLSTISICVITVLTASAQTVTLIPNCGKKGDRVCISGSGWAEPQPVCRYTFAFNGTNVAPDQPDGLFGPPRTAFVVPATPVGMHPVHVELRLNFPDSLLQQADAPFLVVNPMMNDSATTSGSGTSEITLTYTPANPSCESSCRRIVWIQVVQRFARKMGNTDAQAVITTATDWPAFPDGANKSADETQDANRARVDRIWGRTFPYYGVDNTGIPAAGAQNGGMTITVGRTGAPPVAAIMIDAPNTPAAFFPTTIGGAAVTIDKAILRFEAAPFCASGDNVGKYLGKVVTWESHQLATAATATIMNVAVSDGQPSGKFTSALSRWVSGNPAGVGTNRAAFMLPAPVMSPCP